MIKPFKKLITLWLFILATPSLAQTAEITSFFIPLTVQEQSVKMAYRMVKPNSSNHQTILLLHGGLGDSTTWIALMQKLSEAGYTVIAPDQLGFGLSSKPHIQYSFQQLAENTHQLLQTLHIKHVTIIGHSMGGMLGVRFALMFPEVVDKLVLEDPLGLEDYRLLIPYQSVNILAKNNLAHHIDATPDAAFIHALINDMIYTQPIAYELAQIKQPVFLIAGQNDRTAPAKEILSPALQKKLGNFPSLINHAAKIIPHATFVIVPNAAHVPHRENVEFFYGELMKWLNQ